MTKPELQAVIEGLAKIVDDLEGPDLDEDGLKRNCYSLALHVCSDGSGWASFDNDFCPRDVFSLNTIEDLRVGLSLLPSLMTVCPLPVVGRNSGMV